MILQESAVRRAAVFAFYDKEGRVDGYIPFLLKEIKPFCQRLLVMVNGDILEEGRRALEDAGAEVLLRENSGFDITAYRDGILALQGELPSLDELLLFNQTIYGPIYPFSEMFLEMDARDLDFWGMTMHPGLKKDPWGTAGGGAVPHHLQSYFVAVRGNMLHSDAFLQYWQDLPPITTYYEAVGFHEVRFTQKFEELGYTAEPYMKPDELFLYTDYPLFAFPYTMAVRYRCPVIKRKAFFAKREEFLIQDPGEESEKLFRLLRTEHLYPTELILQNLLRSENAYCINLLLAPVRQFEGPAPQCQVLAFVRDNPLAGPLAQLLQGRAVTAAFENSAAKEAYLAAGGAPAAVLPYEPAQILRKVKGPAAFVCNAGASTDNGTLFDRAVLEEGVAAALWGCAFLQQEPDGPCLYMAMPPLHTTGVTNAFEAEEAGEELLFACRSGCYALNEKAALPLARLLEREEGSLFEVKNEFLPMKAATEAESLVGLVVSPEGARAMLLSARYMLDGVSSVWATPYKRVYPQLIYRMQAVLDFYNERRYQMTLDQAVKAKLSLRQKLWIIFRLLLGDKHFETLRRLLTGGKPATVVHPKQDDVD